MIHIWYHANCWDGFGAAWAAYRGLFDVTANHVSYRPVNYGDELPKEPGTLKSSDAVYFLDFSPKLEQAEAILKTGARLLILDHHKTAAEEYAGFRHINAEIIFEMDRSGAVMAWTYFNPSKEIPAILEYIEDRDLWRFKLPNSERVNAALRSYSRDFITWDNLFQVGLIPMSFDMEGGAILRANEVIISEHVKRAFETVLVGHITVLAVNATCLFSEIAGRLSGLSASGIGCAFFQREDERWQYSLRSRGDVDVARIAKLYDGGGHLNAAGFERTELI